MRGHRVSKSVMCGTWWNRGFLLCHFGWGASMWETCSVQLKVRLPRDIAAQAEEAQETDPEFLSRVVLYGMTRRSIYRRLREQNQVQDQDQQSLEERP